MFNFFCHLRRRYKYDQKIKAKLGKCLQPIWNMFVISPKLEFKLEEARGHMLLAQHVSPATNKVSGIQ